MLLPPEPAMPLLPLPKLFLPFPPALAAAVLAADVWRDAPDALRAVPPPEVSAWAVLAGFTSWMEASFMTFNPSLLLSPVLRILGFFRLLGLLPLPRPSS